MNGPYRAFGLTFRTPFPCPGLLPVRDSDADLTVADGIVPRDLASPVAKDKNWQAESGRFLWKGGRRGGRFLIENGRHITMQRGPLTNDDATLSHFLHAVLVAALRQSGRLVLHANSVVTTRGAVAIGGDSGCGKSTTLAALLQRGAQMLSDDITVLQLRNGEVNIVPGMPHFSLCDDAAIRLGYDPSQLQRHARVKRKVIVPGSQMVAPLPEPLRAIYILSRHNGAELTFNKLEGSDKFAALQECIFGPMLPNEHPDHFPLFSALARQVAVFRIDRPIDSWSIDPICDMVLDG